MLDGRDLRQHVWRGTVGAAAGLLLLALLSGCTGRSGGPRTAARASHRAPAADPARGTYVALGDSYTAAPLAADPAELLSGGCLRSDQDYPALVAAALHPSSFVNVSCYGAATADMTHPQRTLGGSSPPQFSALSAADTLVTVQVGGDDIGFSRIAATCGTLSLADPSGSPCQNHYSPGGTSHLARAITRTAPKIAAVLRGIRRRAPRARILLLGYPDILPASGHGCWPRVPIASGDLPYLRSVEQRLNAMLAAEAARNGASYVNTYADSIGHDACQPAGHRWVEGLVPTSLAIPLHPNALGEKAMARQVLATLR